MRRAKVISLSDDSRGFNSSERNCDVSSSFKTLSLKIIKYIFFSYLFASR